MRSVAVEGINDVFVLVDFYFGECRRIVPFYTADYNEPFFVFFSERGNRFFGKGVPFLCRGIDHLVEQLENHIVLFGEFILKFFPNSNKATLQLLALHQPALIQNITVIANCLMHIQNGSQAVFSAPTDKIVENLYDRFTIYVRDFFQNDLVKTEANMIHSERCDVRNVRFGDIAFKMLHVADCNLHSSVGRQYVKAFVIR